MKCSFLAMSQSLSDLVWSDVQASVFIRSTPVITMLMDRAEKLWKVEVSYRFSETPLVTLAENLKG